MSVFTGSVQCQRGVFFIDWHKPGTDSLSFRYGRCFGVFSDGTSAKLTWFYVDGGFTYNEEFSILPGDEPKGE